MILFFHMLSNVVEKKRLQAEKKRVRLPGKTKGKDRSNSMAAPAPAFPKTRRKTQFHIERPEFAQQTLSNPSDHFSKFPNDELEACYSRVSPGVDLLIVLYLTRWTRGGCFEDRDRPPLKGECPRPRALGPRYQRNKDGKITGVTGVRERLAEDLGVDLNTVDKGLQHLSQGENPIIERTEDANYLWLLFHPERLSELPKRQSREVEKKPAASTDDPRSQDEEEQPRSYLAPVSLGGYSQTRWYNAGGTKVRFANRDAEGIVVGFEVEDDGGITIVRPDSSEETELDSRKILRLPKTQVAENNGRVTKTDARATLGFDKFLEACDRGGLTYTDLQVGRQGALKVSWETLAFAQKHAAVSGIDARIENGDYPQFAPRALKYLNEHLWSEKLRARKPKPSTGQKRTDWDSI